MNIRFGNFNIFYVFALTTLLITLSSCKEKEFETVDKEYMGKDKLTVHTDVMQYIDDNEAGIHYITKEEQDALKVKSERESYIFNSMKDGSLIEKYTEKRK